MPSHPLPRAAKLRLLLLLAAGGLVGALAASASSRRIQLCLVAVAVALGIVAGFNIQAARRRSGPTRE